MSLLDTGVLQGVELALTVVVAVVAARLLTRVGLWLLRKVARRTRAGWTAELLETAQVPTRFFLGVLVFGALLPLVELSGRSSDLVQRIWRILLVAGIAWYALRTVDFIAMLPERRAVEGGEANELRRRGIRTQMEVLRRLAHVITAVLAVALVLTQFDVVRSVGVSLLASAGVAGAVVGLAAQKSIGSLLAGIQLSITQPIRIGDHVIVEEEFGTVEEISLTYVVIKVWDERRLVVPIGRFLEQPFQNWTKVSPELIGTVMLYVDYGAPVDTIRAEQERFVRQHPLWDGRVQVLQVSDMSEQRVQLRALVSSRNAPELWDLRCALREHMHQFLGELEGGRYLPRYRLQQEEPADAELGLERQAR